MGLFSKTKNKKAYTWKVYQDVLGDKKLSVRVDTKYKGKNYKNTFYIQLKYSEQETVELPDKEFLNKLTNLEEKAMNSVSETFEGNIVFLGTAIFGGSSYITFASNLDIRWEDYIKSTIDKDLIVGMYPNDNMGYYNQILYPEFIR
ncbi:MAG: DUF695 domain-containing protein [Firmicutes bacterium]|jgi:hypothetical protein|nr:DUF695 domain-containing protein [Bacillota bacterium]